MNLPGIDRFKNAWSALARPQASNPVILEQANLTLDDLYKYLQDNGGNWPYDLYKASFNAQTAIEFSTLSRCITLLAGLGAVMVTRAVYVVDENGTRQTDAKSRRALTMLRESVDGQYASWQFFEDVISDYCLHGNALIAMESTTAGMPSKFRRLLPAGAECSQSSRSRTCVYRAAEADVFGTKQKVYPEQEIIHARWGQMSSAPIEKRMRFANSPIVLLRPAIEIGTRADRYIKMWFERALRGGHYQFDYEEQQQTPGTYKKLNKAERKEIADEVRAAVKAMNPLVTFNGSTSMISKGAGEGENQDVREYQTREVARFYGVPSPIFGADVTRWGGSLEPLARLMYRFGFRLHMGRFLEPLGWRMLRRGTRFEIDPTEFLRGDSEGQLAMVQAIVGDAQRKPIGSMKEARHAAGLPPEVDGELLEPPETNNQSGNGAE